MNIVKRKPKIAVIGLKGLPAFGGAATVGENIIEMLKEKYDFTVYSTSSHTELRSGVYKNICYQKILKALPQKKINSLYYYIISALHAIILGKYDLVHLHHRDAAFIIPFLKIRYKIVLTIHGFGSINLSNKWNRYKWYYQIQEKYFVKKADIITTMSIEHKEIIEKKIKKFVQYIPNGVNLIKIDKEVEDYLFFAAGRIISFKGCDIFLKALHKIDNKRKVLIAGDLETTTDYGKKIIDLSKGLNVSFLGLIKNKTDLFKYYNNAKLFVFPSQIEAMSITLLEVASLKTPIIASRIPGNTQIFSNNEITYFNVNDIDELAKIIEWSINNYDKMLLKAENAYQKLKSYYSWDKISLHYDKIFNNCTNNQKII